VLALARAQAALARARADSDAWAANADAAKGEAQAAADAAQAALEQAKRGLSDAYGALLSAGRQATAPLACAAREAEAAEAAAAAAGLVPSQQPAAAEHGALQVAVQAVRLAREATEQRLAALTAADKAQYSASELLSGARRKEAAYTALVGAAAPPAAPREPHSDAVCDTCAQPITAAHAAQHLAGLRLALAAAQAGHERAAAAKAQAEAALAVARKTQADSEAQEKAERAAAQQADRDSRAAAQRDFVGRTAVATAARRRHEALTQAVTSARTAYKAAAELSTKLFGLRPVDPPPPPASASEPPSAEQLQHTCAHLSQLARALTGAEERAREADAAAAQRAQHLSSVLALPNPHDRVVQSEQANLAAAQAAAAADEAAAEKEAAAARLHGLAEDVLGSKGIQAYLFDELLGELEERTCALLEEVAGGGMRLCLRQEASRAAQEKAEKAAKPARRAKKAADAAPGPPPPPRPAPPEVSKEQIHKRVVVWADPDGAGLREFTRAVESLSGGERRRLGLCLSLAYADLVAARAGLSCELLVLDEALASLDRDGVTRVTELLRRRGGEGTVLLTAQAQGRALGFADAVDTVVKRGAASWVDGGGAMEGEEDEG
jgi:hypothetical protein